MTLDNSILDIVLWGLAPFATIFILILAHDLFFHLKNKHEEMTFFFKGKGNKKSRTD